MRGHSNEGGEARPTSSVRTKLKTESCWPPRPHCCCCRKKTLMNRKICRAPPWPGVLVRSLRRIAVQIIAQTLGVATVLCTLFILRRLLGECLKDPILYDKRDPQPCVESGHANDNARVWNTSISHSDVIRLLSGGFPSLTRQELSPRRQPISKPKSIAIRSKLARVYQVGARLLPSVFDSFSSIFTALPCIVPS